MSSLEKVSNYLDSFTPEDANFDYACYIREKLADMQAVQSAGVINSEESTDEHTGDLDTSEQDKAHDNLEGKLMHGAFQDLEALNQIDKDKLKVASPVKDLLDKITSKK